MAVAAIGIPGLIIICYLGRYYLFIFSLVLVGLGGFELATMSKNKGYRVNLFFSSLLPMFCIAAAYYNYPVLNVLTLSFFIITLIAVIDYSHAESPDFSEFLENFFDRLLPVMYLGLLMPFAIYLGKLPDIGRGLLIFVFLTVWATDTAAYFGGKTAGRNKLSHRLSPGKTREGFYFGFLGAIGAAVVSNLLFLKIGWPKILTMAMLACFSGQIGDLFESGIKRFYQAKDSSKIIPGHGGVLDRFDSFLFAAPVVYFIAITWK